MFQEAILEALRSEHTYDPDRDLRFWLLGIAMNVVRRHVERVRQARRRLHPEPPADDEAVEALHEQLRRAGSRLQSGPEEAMALREEAEGVLADLPEQHREVLRLYYFEHDNDHEAVAAALGITPGAARTRLCRALQAARKGSSR